MRWFMMVLMLVGMVAHAHATQQFNQPRSGVEGGTRLALPVEGATRAPVIVDRVVAIVNNDVITEREVETLRIMAGGALSSSNTKGDLRARAIERLIDERLLAQAMEKESIELTEEELAQAFNQFLTANRLNREQLGAALASHGMNLDRFQQQMASQLRQMKFIQSKLGGDIRLNDTELRNFYHRQVRPGARAMTYHISEIVVTPTPKDPTAVLKKADKLAQTARRGDFAKVAKAHSTGPTAADGGERGAVAATDLRPELAAAVQRLRVGQVSDPIATPDGIFIIKLNAARSPTDADFAERKSQIQQALFQNKMTEALEQYLGKLRAKAYIELRE